MSREPKEPGAAGAKAVSSEPGASPTPPQESFVRPPRVEPSPADHVFGADQMVHFYDAPGEYGYMAEGRDHGFTSLSVIITDTRPGGGPPLHSHDTEEAQVLPRGRYRVLIGEQRYEVVGPATVRIPAGMPHTFVNPGDQPVHIVGVFPSERIGYREIGPNPLLPDAAGDAIDPPPDQGGRMSRSNRSPTAPALLLALAVAGGACGDAASPTLPTEVPVSAASHPQPTSAEANADLAAARGATAHLQRFENAAPGGWDLPVTSCVENPPLGGMGFHFGNLELYLDGEANPAEPEILLYEPQRNGRLRLVAVEYAVPFFAWGTGDPDVDDPPRLFERAMKRVDAHGEWQLHVWLWKHNPSGIFADWNPTVTCEHAPAGG